jgi:hypothetical protein
MTKPRTARAKAEAELIRRAWDFRDTAAAERLLAHQELFGNATREGSTMSCAKATCPGKRQIKKLTVRGDGSVLAWCASHRTPSRHTRDYIRADDVFADPAGHMAYLVEGRKITRADYVGLLRFLGEHKALAR